MMVSEVTLARGASIVRLGTQESGRCPRVPVHAVSRARAYGRLPSIHGTELPDRSRQGRGSALQGRAVRL
jgi:hypothetical protein